MRDLEEVLDLNLELPVRGKTYLVRPPDAQVGAELLNLLAFGIAADAGIDVGEEVRGRLEVGEEDLPDFGRKCLGPVLDELVADKVPARLVEFCIETAFFAWTIGRPYAEHYWETGGKLGRPAVQRLEELRTGTPTRPAAESTTSSSASPSGTSSHARG